MIGRANVGGCDSLIGVAFSFIPPFCIGPEGSRVCLTQPPARDPSATAIFTIDKTNPDQDYIFSFYNTQGGTAEVTLKIYIDNELESTIHKTVDLRYTGACPEFAQYP